MQRGEINGLPRLSVFGVVHFSSQLLDDTINYIMITL